MKSTDALRQLADVTSSQWGMVTTAQAGEMGVPRLTLSRLADSGHLERLTHGVYRGTGVPGDQFDSLRAAWLSTEPKLRAESRLRDLTSGVVVASSSAAMLHGIGDLWATRHEFVSPNRRQTQRAEIRYRQRHLDDVDVTLVEGLPVMTLERTLADLLEETGEMSLVADALGAAARKRSLDLNRLRELLGPLAERNGHKRHDGDAVLDRLLVIAGLDLDAVAGRAITDPALGGRIVEKILTGSGVAIPWPGMSELSQRLQSVGPEVPPEVMQRILETIRPQIALNERLQTSLFSAQSLKGGNALERYSSTSAIGDILRQGSNASKSVDVNDGRTGAASAEGELDE